MLVPEVLLADIMSRGKNEDNKKKETLGRNYG